MAALFFPEVVLGIRHGANQAGEGRGEAAERGQHLPDIARAREAHDSQDRQTAVDPGRLGGTYEAPLNRLGHLTTDPRSPYSFTVRNAISYYEMAIP